MTQQRSKQRNSKHTKKYSNPDHVLVAVLLCLITITYAALAAPYL